MLVSSGAVVRCSTTPGGFGVATTFTSTGFDTSRPVVVTATVPGVELLLGVRSAMNAIAAPAKISIIAMAAERTPNAKPANANGRWPAFISGQASAQAEVEIAGRLDGAKAGNNLLQARLFACECRTSRTVGEVATRFRTKYVAPVPLRQFHAVCFGSSLFS